MPGQNDQFVHFLQHECARLRDENKELTETSQALRRYVKALHTFQETAQYYTPEQAVLGLLDEALRHALELLDASDGSLMLLDEERNDLVFVLVHGAVRETLPGYRFDRHEGIAGWVADHGEPKVVNNIPAEPLFSPMVDTQFGFQTQALVAVPLIAQSRVQGVIEVINKRAGQDFTNYDVELLSILATLAALALAPAAD